MSLMINHFPGFFATKMARKVQDMKERLGVTQKLEDRDYENLVRRLKRSNSLSRQPAPLLLDYICAVRHTAVAYNDVCGALRDILVVYAISDQLYIARLNAIQDDVHRLQLQFLSTLNDLSAWIGDNLRQADEDMQAVRAATAHCQHRRLDSVLVSRKCSTTPHAAVSCSSIMAQHHSTSVNHSYSTDSDSSMVSHSFPATDTDSSSSSVVSKLMLNSDLYSASAGEPQPVQEIAGELYIDAKEYAMDLMEGMLQANVEDNYNILTEFQPRESAYEVVTTHGRALIMSMFHDLLHDSTRREKSQQLDIREVRKALGRLIKELQHYTHCLCSLAKAKASYHQAVVSALEGEGDSAALQWYPDSKQDMVVMPVEQLHAVCSVLEKQMEKLDCAQVIQDLVRSDTDWQVPTEELEVLKHHLPSTLRHCLSNIVKAEQVMQAYAEDGARRFKKIMDSSVTTTGDQSEDGNKA